MKIIFAPVAEQDLADLFSYISNDLSNPIAAHNIANKILQVSQKLSDFPGLGAELKTIDTRLDNYRYLIVDNYLIIYKVIDQEVYILRILYARSDYVKLLEK
ncbi:MAG TPA: type II toxin-antitoxin system RelE/ParE family toxin [Candidatus Saccharimonadales bacterium]|nr:type II toxin-antitoxin system RelE/ParE family toxin [Candidatus Saccharimonadales bacterium]